MNPGAWREGRQAWERLAAWARGVATAVAWSGDASLDALSDVGRLRRLLDQAELDAVRLARQHGRSWAEIAVNLGITRQSAWEKWRDLEEVAAAPADQARARAAGESAARARRAATVTVPNVVGLRWEDARRVLGTSRLVGVGADPDGPPLAMWASPDATVVDQSPEAGAKARPGSSVTVWVRRDGGSGVREPRRPGPAPGPAREQRPEPDASAERRLAEGGSAVL